MKMTIQERLQKSLESEKELFERAKAVGDIMIMLEFGFFLGRKSAMEDSIEAITGEKKV